MRSTLVILLGLLAPIAHAQGTAEDYRRADSLASRFNGKVFRNNVAPHWLEGGKRLWYTLKLADGRSETYLVDARTGAKGLVKDTSQLPKDGGGSLPAFLPPRPSGSGEEASLTLVNHSQIPVDVSWIDQDGRARKYFTLQPGESRVQHTFAEHVWLLTDAGGKRLAAYRAEAGDCEAVFDGRSPTPPPAPRPQELSPDGKWLAVIREHNLWLHPTDGGADVQVSTDGKAGDDYQWPILWSPDGKRLLAERVEAGDEHRVHMVQSSPPNQVQPKLTTINYLKPGDKIPHPRLMVFDAASHGQTVVKTDLTPNPWSLTEFHWAPDSREVFFIYNQRGHQVLRLLAATATSGDVRTVVEETSPTFIDYTNKVWVSYLDRTNEAVWMSERSGYNHLYLVDLAKGGIKNPITQGDWNVRGVDEIDPEGRKALLRVSAIDPAQDPYHVHYLRAKFDGTAPTRLTDGDGTHRIVWAPDRETFLDIYSRVDLPPVTELRRASDGGRLAVLEVADAAPLKAQGWTAPERFVAKGRDGKTDIWGVIYRPTDFDPKRHYPVIEDIYAGPHGAFVPKAFAPYYSPMRMAEIGFVVVQIDGMGTNWRSKKFHDVAYKNLADAGFPDRIAWMKAAAATRPWMDLTRVGVYGTSAGGQSAASAVMRFGDFYKAAVADCGCHDNRMDKIWWNEQWMGWPVDESYARNSNVTAAKDLKGRLFLMVGELDTNVDPASTMQVANALIQAGKDFELLVVPNAGHGVLGGAYAYGRMRNFFVETFLKGR